MNNPPIKQRGFTLVELMITIAIIGILASVATVQFSEYVVRAKFVQLKMASSPVKKYIETCYQANDGADACNVSAVSSTLSGQVTTTMLLRAASADVIDTIELTGTTYPIVVVTAGVMSPFAGETYQLTGTVSGIAGVNRTITDWTESGSGCDLGWC